MSESKQILQLILDEIKSVNKRTEKQEERLDSIDKTLIKQEEQISYHIKRTDLLEAKADAIEEDIKPLKERMNQFDGMKKLFVIVGSLLAAAVAIVEIIRFFS